METTYIKSEKKANHRESLVNRANRQRNDHNKKLSSYEFVVGVHVSAFLFATVWSTEFEFR